MRLFNMKKSGISGKICNRGQKTPTKWKILICGIQYEEKMSTRNVYRCTYTCIFFNIIPNETMLEK